MISDIIFIGWIVVCALAIWYFYFRDNSNRGDV